MSEPVAPIVRNDKRQARRRPLFITATIAVSSNPAQPCVVHDVSETGARIETGRPDAVPDRFTLWLTPNGFPRRECKVVWRRDGLLGVAFVARKPLSVQPL